MKTNSTEAEFKIPQKMGKSGPKTGKGEHKSEHHHESVASLLGQPALVQLLERSCGDKSDKERKEIR